MSQADPHVAKARLPALRRALAAAMNRTFLDEVKPLPLPEQVARLQQEIAQVQAAAEGRAPAPPAAMPDDGCFLEDPAQDALVRLRREGALLAEVRALQEEQVVEHAPPEIVRCGAWRADEPGPCQALPPCEAHPNPGHPLWERPAASELQQALTAAQAEIVHLQREAEAGAQLARETFDLRQAVLVAAGALRTAAPRHPPEASADMVKIASALHRAVEQSGGEKGPQEPVPELPPGPQGWRCPGRGRA